MRNSISGLSREEIARNRRIIKKSISPNSFFHFLSADLLRIREFSRRNGIIHFSFFIFMKLDTQLPERFIGQIQRTLAEPLHKALAPVVENGWRVFEKLEYNKLVFIHDFARAIAAVQPAIFQQPAGKLLEQLKGIEQAFFILSSDHSLIAALERQLEMYAKLGHVQNFPVDGIIKAIQTLLSANITRLSLFSLFISLNSLVNRKYCDIEMMIDDPGRIYFSSDEFDLDEHSRLLLANYSHEVIISIKKQISHHHEISLYKGLIPLKGERFSEHDLTLLRQFYNTGTGEQDRFGADWSNILAFLLSFANRITSEFKRFLTSDFKARGTDKNVQVFDKTLFSNYLIRIGYLKDKLDKLIIKNPKFERSRYLRVLSEGNLNVNAGEEPVIGHISELLNIFFQIARTLALILRHGSHSKNPANVAIIRPIAFGDVQFFIPYEKTKQYSSVFLAGQTVREAMETIASVLLLACLELREAELVTILRKDMHTMDTLKNLIKELKRISTRRQFEELQDELDLINIEKEMS